MAPLSAADIQKLLAGPAGAPPPGQMPHYGGRPMRLTSDIVEISITLALSTCAVLLRLFTQHFISSGLVLEDYIIVLANIFQAGAVTVGVLCVQHGSGNHMWDITLHGFIELQKRVFFFSILYNVALTGVKVALLLQFTRVLAPHRINKRAWIICWICIVANVTFYAVNILLQIFQCSPVSKMWNMFEPGHCISLAAIYKSSGIFNVISDFSILSIPMPIIFQLNMSIKKRIGVAAVFATGAIACGSSIARAYYTWRVFDSSDASYYIWLLGLWCQIEMCIGFLVFCVPIFPQFYHYTKGRAGKSLPTTQLSLSHNISTTPKRSKHNPYELPSLASFEARESRDKFDGGYLEIISEGDRSPSNSRSGSSHRDFRPVSP